MVAPIITASTVVEFIQALAAMSRAPGVTRIFRGQRNAAWGVSARIMRSGTSILGRERDAVRDLVAVHPQEFLADQSMFDRLVRMQHYGLPTRLLDTTINPLVALYFATQPFGSRTNLADGKVFLFSVPEERKKYYDSDAVSCISNLANLSSDEKGAIENSSTIDRMTFNGLPPIDRLLQFIKVEKPYFRHMIDPEDLFKPYFVIPKMSNRRIIAQSGSFIIYGLTDPIGVRYKKSISMDGIIIPHSAKSSIRSELDDLGVNESTLFPEIDKAANYIVARYTP